MADYKTKAQNIYLNIAGSPAEKLRVRSTLVYNVSIGEYDQVIMPDVTDRLNGDLSHQDFTFDEMHEYSNLDYNLLQVSAGFDYKLSPQVTFTLDGEYADFTDDAGWVYGIESGSLFEIRSGFRVDF
jgi:hypothetical protein